MKRWFLAKLISVTFVFLAWTVPSVSSIIIPVELIRVVTVLPQMVTTDSIGMSWLAMGLALKAAAIGFYLGLPRGRAFREVTRDYDWALFHSEETSLHDRIITAASYIDAISDMDGKECIARLLCLLQSKPEEEVTAVQKMVLNVLWMSATPSWNYSNAYSPRKNLINALHFGKIASCFQCCQLVYKTCEVSAEVLLHAI